MGEYRGGLFAGYCYGPVDVLSLEQSSNSMYLLLRSRTGRLASAYYEGCAYWRLGCGLFCTHFSLVQQISREELLSVPDSITMRELRKNSENVPELLRDWERENLKFYLHYGPKRDSEYLVAADRLTYTEFD